MSHSANNNHHHQPIRKPRVYYPQHYGGTYFNRRENDYSHSSTFRPNEKRNDLKQEDLEWLRSELRRKQRANDELRDLIKQKDEMISLLKSTISDKDELLKMIKSKDVKFKNRRDDYDYDRLSPRQASPSSIRHLSDDNDNDDNDDDDDKSKSSISSPHYSPSSPPTH